VDNEHNVAAQAPEGKGYEIFDTLPDPKLRITPPDNAYQKWLAFAGGHAHSVIPPGGKLDPSWIAWRRSKAVERGADPDRAETQTRVSAAGGKAPGYWHNRGWKGCAIAGTGTDHTPYDAGARRKYEKSVVWHDGSVGVWAGRTPALDVDVLDSGLAALVLGALSQALGVEPWRREGQAPKFLVPFRLRDRSAGFGKYWATVKDESSGAIYRLELLGAGQQWVCAGTHGKTGHPYMWHRGAVTGPVGLPPCDRSELPAVNEVEAVGLLEAAIGAMEEAGCVVLARGGGKVPVLGAGVLAPVDPMALLGPEGLMREAVLTIPNTWSVDRDAWVGLCHAIKGASGGAGWGLELFIEWSGQWPGGGSADNDVMVWEGIRDPRIGARWIIDRAREAGWEEAGRFGVWVARRAFRSVDTGRMA
jgi:hypothetical protein